MITLSSDFRWPYPAAMKGVILGIDDARLVDVTHDLPRQDVRASAFWLRELLPYFPPAVHLAVVDPGVGTNRAAIAVRAGDHALVGPDNGVLLPAARALAGGRDLEVFDIPYGEGADAGRVAEAIDTDDGPAGVWPDDPGSSTFHGRDVFAPAAAHVHATGIDGFETELGLRRAESYETIEFQEPTVESDGADGEVLAVDAFGNAITNVPGDAVAERFGATITVNGETVPVRRAYAAVEPGERLVTVGSHDNVELAVNRGRGDDAFGVEAGDGVSLSW